jgi:hypothetical protein
MTSQRDGGGRTDPDITGPPQKEEDVRATQNPARIQQGGSDIPPDLLLSVQLLGIRDPEDAEYEAWLDRAEEKIGMRLRLYRRGEHSAKLDEIPLLDLSSGRFKIG